MRVTTSSVPSFGRPSCRRPLGTRVRSATCAPRLAERLASFVGGAAGQSECFLYRAAVAAPRRELGAVRQRDDVLAVQLRTELADEADVDRMRAMDAQEFSRVEQLHQSRQRLLVQVRA